MRHHCFTKYFFLLGMLFITINNVRGTETVAFNWSKMGTGGGTPTSFTIETSGVDKGDGYYIENSDGTSILRCYNANSAMFTSTPAKVTITVKIGGTIGKDLGNPVYARFTGNDGKGFSNKTLITNHISTSEGETYTIDMDLTDVTSAHGIMIYHIKESGYCVRYYSLKCTITTYEPVTRTTVAGKYGTLCMPFSFNVEGANLYTINSVNSGSITLNEIGTSGTAGVPYIYQAYADSQTFSYASGKPVSEPVTNSYLTGTFTQITVPEGNYVMQTLDNIQGFYKVNSNNITCGPYKCYLNGSAVK